VLGIKCSTLHVEGKPVMVTMDYKMDVALLSQEYGRELVQQRLVIANDTVCIDKNPLKH